MSRVDSLLEEIEQVTTENKSLKNDLSQVAELLELPEPSDHALKFLSSSLTTFDPSVPIITTTRPTAITLMELGDQEFETATTTMRSLSFIRFALKKRQLSLEGSQLFEAVKGTKPTSETEVNGLARDIRVGEFFLKLIHALNLEGLSVSQLSDIVGQEPEIKSLEELKGEKLWINCSYSSSHFEKKIKREMWKNKVCLYKLWQLLQQLKTKANKQPSSTNKRSRK